MRGNECLSLRVFGPPRRIHFIAANMHKVVWKNLHYFGKYRLKCRVDHFVRWIQTSFVHAKALTGLHLIHAPLRIGGQPMSHMARHIYLRNNTHPTVGCVGH